MTKKYLDELTYNVIGAAIEVHKCLGPGLLESIYHSCLKYELYLRGIEFKSEMIIPVFYKDVKINADLKCDLYVENCMVVELKSIETFAPVYKTQLLTYMKLLKAPKGILINFNCSDIFNDGQKTFVNELFKNLPDI